MLAALRARHPLVSMDVMARTSTGTRQGLMSGELDVGVPRPPGRTELHLLRTDERAVQGRGPDRLEGQIDAADWADLANLPWLTPSSSSAYSAMLAQLFGDKGLELNTVIRFDTAVGRTALRAGAGMMLLREDHAVQGEQEGYLALSPIAQAQVACPSRINPPERTTRSSRRSWKPPESPGPK